MSWRTSWRRLTRDEGGGPLAEFALTFPLLFVIGLVALDFSWVFTRIAMAEYAAHVAVRTAAVRPAVCPGVPDSIERKDGLTTRFGELCTHPDAPCNYPATIQCTGAGTDVGGEIIDMVEVFLPAGASEANLQFTYAPPPDSSIGFLGGPYVPIVSVSLINLQHNFILPIPTLLSPWSGSAGGAFAPITLGPFTATMPGEDLNDGTTDEPEHSTSGARARQEETMPHALNVTAVTRSMSTKNFIENALSGQKSLRLESHLGDLQAVNGKILHNLDQVDLLLVDLDVENAEEMTHLARIVQQQKGKTAIVVTAADVTTHGIRGLIRQGVDDFVPQPLESHELFEAVEAARLKMRALRSADGLGQVVAFGRAKGGTGATSMAIHTALALAAKHRRRDPGKKVALLDLDLQFGDIGMQLDLPTNDTLAEIIKDPSRLDPELLHQAMTRHEHSGVSVLQAPSLPVPLDALRSDTTRRLIELTREEFDYVVLDLPLALPRWLEAVLQQTDQLLLVTQLNVPAVRQTRRLMDILGDEGLFEMPVSVVLNRYVWRFSERARIKQSQGALGRPFDHYIPNDYEQTLEAINRGVTLFEVSKRSKLSKAIREMAGKISMQLAERRAAARLEKAV